MRLTSTNRHLTEQIVKGAKPRAAFRSGRLAATADQVRQVGNERLACHVEPAAQVIPERDALLGTGLGQTEKSIAAIASDLAAGAGTDLAAGDVAAGVVLGALCVERGLPPLPYHQQPGLVGMQPRPQPLKAGETGGGAEDTVEARA